MMTCPRCRGKLSGIKHETGIAWRCIACGGQTLNFSQLRRLIPESHANRIWESVMEMPERPRMKSLCPECDRDMAAVFFPTQGRLLELDICRSCQRVWLDSAQLPAHALPDVQDMAPEPEPQPMKGEAMERAAKELIARKRFLPNPFFELNGRRALLFALLFLVFVFFIGVMR